MKKSEELNLFVDLLNMFEMKFNFFVQKVKEAFKATLIDKDVDTFVFQQKNFSKIYIFHEINEDMFSHLCENCDESLNMEDYHNVPMFIIDLTTEMLYEIDTTYTNLLDRIKETLYLEEKMNIDSRKEIFEKASKNFIYKFFRYEKELRKTELISQNIGNLKKALDKELIFFNNQNNLNRFKRDILDEIFYVYGVQLTIQKVNVEKLRELGV